MQDVEDQRVATGATRPAEAVVSELQRLNIEVPPNYSDPVYRSAAHQARLRDLDEAIEGDTPIIGNGLRGI